MKILAVYNLKGGVGKTATAVNLADAAARAGMRTLLWDLDPQAAATYYLRIEAHVDGGGKALVRRRKDGGTGLEAAIKASDFANLDLLPGDFSLRNLDLLIETAKGRQKRLRHLLRPLAGDYDLVVLDCPAGISRVAESVFMAADIVLVPVIPTTLSARTLEQLAGFLGEKSAGPRVLPFFSMVDRRRQLHRTLQEALRQHWTRFLDTAIPVSAEVERMGVERMPVHAYARSCPAARAYEALWSEVAPVLEATDAND